MITVQDILNTMKKLDELNDNYYETDNEVEEDLILSTIEEITQQLIDSIVKFTNNSIDEDTASKIVRFCPYKLKSILTGGKQNATKY